MCGSVHSYLPRALVASHQIVDWPLLCVGRIVCEACDNDAVQEVAREVGRGAPLGDELISERGEVNATISRCVERDEEDL